MRTCAPRVGDGWCRTGREKSSTDARRAAIRSTCKATTLRISISVSTTPMTYASFAVRATGRSLSCTAMDGRYRRPRRTSYGRAGGSSDGNAGDGRSSAQCVASRNAAGVADDYSPNRVAQNDEVTDQMSRMPSGCWTYLVPIMIFGTILAFSSFGKVLDDFAGHQGLPVPVVPVNPGSPPAQQAQPYLPYRVGAADTSKLWAGTWEGDYATSSGIKSSPVDITLTQSGTGNQGVSGTADYAGFSCTATLTETQDEGSGIAVSEVDTGDGCSNVNWRFSLNADNTMTIAGIDSRNGTLQGTLARIRP